MKGRTWEEPREGLLETESLALIGSISTQVAHDLRNPLTAINTTVYCLEESLTPSERRRLKHLLVTLRSSVGRASDILEDLVELSQPPQGGKSALEVAQIVKEALAEVTVPPGVAVSLKLEEGAFVKGNDRKLVLAVRNCVENSIDAMPKGGRLAITTSVIDGHAVLAVSDSGEGIAKENMEKLFTPFFTTKARGLGVGLAITKGIVDAHGGEVSVSSTVGRGTTMKISLPALLLRKGGSPGNRGVTGASTPRAAEK